VALGGPRSTTGCRPDPSLIKPNNVLFKRLASPTASGLLPMHVHQGRQTRSGSTRCSAELSDDEMTTSPALNAEHPMYDELLTSLSSSSSASSGARRSTDRRRHGEATTPPSSDDHLTPASREHERRSRQHREAPPSPQQLTSDR